MPEKYRASITALCKVKKRMIGRSSSGVGGMNVAMKSVYTGSLAEHVISGATRMVINRSRLEGIVRVAMIPGTAQANELKSGTKDLPLMPKLEKTRSKINAALAK